MWDRYVLDTWDEPTYGFNRAQPKPSWCVSEPKQGKSNSECHEHSMTFYIKSFNHSLPNIFHREAPSTGHKNKRFSSLPFPHTRDTMAVDLAAIWAYIDSKMWATGRRQQPHSAEATTSPHATEPLVKSADKTSTSNKNNEPTNEGLENEP
jgi:hypothetical protein